MASRDLSGPLVDRSLIALADFYYTRADYGTAAEKYDFLLSQYPKSRFRRRANWRASTPTSKITSVPNTTSPGLKKPAKRSK